MILTSNFKIAGHLPQAVAISLGVPGLAGTRCTVLAPPRPLIKIMDPQPSPGFIKLRSWTGSTLCG